MSTPLKLADRGDTRDKVAEAIGINRNTLETIREIGSLAETGTTAKEPAREEPKKPAVSNPVKLTVAPVQVDEEEEAEEEEVEEIPEPKEPDKDIELKKEIAKK